MQAIRIGVIPLGEARDLPAQWLDLQARSRHSFFLSWCWISRWLGILPPTADPLVLTAHRGRELVGLAILVRNKLRRHGFVTSKALYLHESGDPAIDDIMIEHNGILASCGIETEVWRQVLETLVVDEIIEWDEFCLAGITGGCPIPGMDDYPGLRVEKHTRPAYRIHLEKFRGGDRDYLSGLGKNTRARIRKAIRHYGEDELRLESADSRDCCHSWLAELRNLHQDHWQRKGQNGAFSNPAVIRFHENLIDDCFDTGTIELLRISAGPTLLGYLYNFVYEGHVYFYQSAFTYERPELSPGLLCHYLAIEHYIDRDARVYDFLAGDSRYKRSLASERYDVHWALLQRDRLRFRLERLMRLANYILFRKQF